MSKSLPRSALLVMLLLAAVLAAGAGPVVVRGIAEGMTGLDAHVLRVARFTLLQAGLSTLLSLLLGLPLARALARQDFAGRRWLLRLLALPNGLPAIVGVLGLVAIFGERGWFGGLLPLYGLGGILLAHVFFNAPLVARAGLAALEAVPAESHRLAAELGFGRRELWRYLDRPALLAALPGTALLVFLLCAASFTIVLTLGGGPAATTLEVAIYQALRFDFDPARATALALVQLCLCAGLVALSQRFPARFVSAPPLRAMAYRADRGEARAGDGAVILLALLVLLPPLAAVVTNGLAGLALSRDLLAALATSLALGAGSALVSLGLAWPLAQAAARRPSLRRLTTGLVLGGLILPPAVLATGWFLLASRWAVAVTLAPLLVLMLNALMALPFTYTSLAPAMAQAAAAHDRLCASLGLSGLPRLARIDLPVLRQPLALAMTMAAIVSLGDLSAITLFGTGGFTTLPALLYRQMGSYRMTGAGGTALVLMALAVTLIALADRWSRTDD